jgi:enoyl-CoA hydratase/carnithine racemase
MGKVHHVIEDRIATVTFTNPPKGFFTSEMVVQLGEVMTALEHDPAVRVIIFTGGLPDVFIRHFSVEEIIGMAGALKENRARGLPEPRFARTPLRRVWEQVDDCQKPTIAAINGYCGGGGCELTLCCDIRLAGPGDYTIGQMEILVGLLPGAGGTTRLARAVGTAKALEWVLRGRTFGPKEAAREGLIHHYVEGDVLAAARAMACEFLDKPPVALTYIKQVLRGSHGRPTADGVDEEGDLFANLIAQDARCLEMMQQYVESGHQLKKI